MLFWMADTINAIVFFVPAEFSPLVKTGVLNA